MDTFEVADARGKYGHKYGTITSLMANPLHVWYSNRIEALVPHLAARLTEVRQAGQNWDAVFSKLPILVPNGNVATYLRYRLAEAMGISSNLEFPFLRSFLRRCMSDGAERLRVLERGELQNLFLAVLTNEEEYTAPELAPVRAYIESVRDADGRDRRRFQLAERLASVFSEYAVSRPDFLAAWLDGRLSLSDTDYAQSEAWQAFLWRRIYGPGGLIQEIRLLNEETVPWLLTTDAWRVWLTDTPAEKAAADLPKQVHVFGFSYIGRAFQEMLASLSHRTEVHVYALNPCMEFWEDVRTHKWAKSPSKAFAKRDERTLPGLLDVEEEPYGEGDTPALQLWGRPGRENIRLLNDLTGGQFHESYINPLETGGSEKTLLGRLQHDILVRSSDPSVVRAGFERQTSAFETPPNFVHPEETMEQSGVDSRRVVRDGPPSPKATAGLLTTTDGAGDPEETAQPTPEGSIQLLACPGLRREVEVIAEEIAQLVSTSDLRFNDIGVLIAGGDTEGYLAHIGNTFHRLGIPTSTTDRAPGGESRIAEAVDFLLELPFGELGRSDMLKLITHPLVGEQMPQADVDQWVEWIGETNILFGADQSAFADTYVEKDLFNWDQGLRRIGMGAWMAGETAAQDERFHAPDRTEHPGYPIEDYESEAIPAAGRLTLFVRSLIADAQAIKDAKLPLREWAPLLADWIRSYVKPADEADENALRSCLQAISDLADDDITARPVSYRIAVSHLQQVLGSIGGRTGHYLAHGVSVSAFAPMRAIPFRAIFVVGMGEGRFPASDNYDPIDLRQARRRAGDVTRKEQDKYMFLETLLAARDRLYVSYISRDGKTGDELSPSTVVQELLFMLANGYLNDEALAQRTRTFPLHRFEGGAETQAYDPEARNEADAVNLRQSLRATLGAWPADENLLLGMMTDDARTEVARRLALPGPLPAQETAEERTRLGTSGLRRFLECPVQGWAQTRLGLDDADDDSLADVDDNEPLTADFLGQLMLLRATFQQAGHDGNELEAAHAAAYEREELRGNMPTGVWAEPVIEQQRGVLEAWRRHAAGIGELNEFRMVRFGNHGAGRDNAVIHPPIELPIGGTTIEINGGGELTSPDGNTIVLALAKKKPSEKDFFRGFLFAALLTAGGHRTGAFEVYCLTTDGEADCRRAFGDLTQASAHDYLAGIVRSLYTEAHDVFFCIDGALKHLSNPEKYDLLSCLQADRGACSYGTGSCSYGPVEGPDQFNLPDSGTASRWADERYGLFAKLQSSGSQDSSNRREAE